MNIIRLLFISATAILAFGCSRSVPDIPVESSDSIGETPASTVAGVLHVEFTEDMANHIEAASESELSQEMGAYGITSLSRMFPDAGEFEARHRESGLHHWYRVSYDPDIPATKAAADFSEIPGAATVEIPRKIHTAEAFPFNDPYSDEQWNLYNTAQLPRFVSGIDINVLPLWEITGGSKDVIVNVVDTGVDMNHEDLAGVCIPAGSDGSANFVDGMSSYTISADKHGTHVAGTIAAVSNNGIGISGIAGGTDGNGGVRILCSQIFHEKADGTEEGGGNPEAAIVWGADHGALISQNSWGYDYDNERQAMESDVPRSFKAAVDYFIKNAGCDAAGNQVGLMKGGIVIFAAGNEGWKMGHPGDYEPIVAVGAIGPDGRKATYSNYGSWVDICAPGGEFDRFDNPIAMILAPAGKSDEYFYMAGTSMSCPHVSGVAALLISAFGGPGFTCDELKRILIDGANYNLGDSEGIGPMLDAYGSYLEHGGVPKPRIRTDYTGDYNIKGHERLDVNFTVVSEKDVNIEVQCDNSAYYAVHDKSIAVSLNDGSGKLTGIHRLTIKATDTSGQSDSKTIDYTILENHAPKVIYPIEDKVVSAMGSVTDINLANIFMDEDGGELTFTTSVSGDHAFDCSRYESAYGEMLALTSTSNGIMEITITATDPCGLGCSTSFKAGMFNGADGPALYPNPVSDWLNVCPTGISETKVTIYNASGKKISSGQAKASILEPFRIDMSTFAPGRYKASVEYGGKTYNKDVIKK